MDLKQFIEKSKSADLYAELEGIYRLATALGSPFALDVTAAACLVLRAGLPRFVVDYIVLDLAKRQELELVVFGIINQDLLYFNNTVLGVNKPDLVRILPDWPEVTEEIQPKVSLMFSMGAIQADLK